MGDSEKTAQQGQSLHPLQADSAGCNSKTRITGPIVAGVAGVAGVSAGQPNTFSPHSRYPNLDVLATKPPPGWDGLTCAGCLWPDLCRVLGPRGTALPGGPCLTNASQQMNRGAR